VQVSDSSSVADEVVIWGATCPGGTSKQAPRNREEEDLIETLYAQVKDLKTKNTKLTKENEKLTELYERKKKEVSIMSKARARSTGASGTLAGHRKPSPEPATRNGSPPKNTRATPGKPKSSALTESNEIDIRAASARRSGGGDAAVSLKHSSGITAALDHDKLMRVAETLQTR
jgi:hypothetical protein